MLFSSCKIIFQYTLKEMSSHGREVEVTISSAKDIKNVNWRNGPNKPYAVVWIDPKFKSSTRVDEDGNTCTTWNETFVIALPPANDDDDKVYINIVHAGREENTKPLIGSAHLSLRDVIDDVGFGVPFMHPHKSKRLSLKPYFLKSFAHCTDVQVRNFS